MPQNKPKKIFIKINGKKYQALEGQNILEVAQKNNIDIPALCYHPDLDIKANCRLCLVEIKGRKGLHTSCSTQAQDKMEITTESKAINRARKTNLELIVGEHREDCISCIYGLGCDLRKWAVKYQVNTSKFPNRKLKYPKYQFGPSLIFDSSKCIECGNCVEACAKQQANFLVVRKKGHTREVVPNPAKNADCIYCGMCFVHCPVGAFEEVSSIDEVEEAIEDKDKVVVFQFAPSIRTSIGEEFKMPYGEVVTDKIVAGIKMLGADKVFDTCVGADFTTYEEAKELIEKIEKGCTPCFSSCCPSWVKFLEFHYPQYIKNIATTRSPQTILGGLIKTYWAKKKKIDPRKIVVVSVMPCISKKYESKRPQNKVDNLYPIDYTLTTRELARLFKKYQIDLKTIKPVKADNPLGIPSGAGVIYGASGGVMESAIRTAFALLNKGKPPKIEFKEIRGMQGVKKATLCVNGKCLHAVVVNGMENVKPILDELKKNPAAYCAVEVMACPGGCIGGGGQPVPTSAEIRKKRADSLYRIDKNSKIRLAHENPILKKIYKEYLTNQKLTHKICHTTYSRKNKENKF